MGASYSAARFEDLTHFSAASLISSAHTDSSKEGVHCPCLLNLAEPEGKVHSGWTLVKSISASTSVELVTLENSLDFINQRQYCSYSGYSVDNFRSVALQVIASHTMAPACKIRNHPHHAHDNLYLLSLRSGHVCSRSQAWLDLTMVSSLK